MIIWLASYPKSGNTWIRSLLASYYFSKDGNFDLNLLKKIDQFPSYDHFKKYNETFLNPTDTCKYWLKEQEKINFDKKIRFFKTHNALCKINNFRFTNSENTLGVIYIIRDPRNVITSISHHYQIDIEKAFEFMTTENKGIIKKNKNSYIGFVAIFSWIFHQKSWTENILYPTLTIKYEELENETYKTLERIIKFINKIKKSSESFNQEKAKKAVESCDFKNLPLFPPETRNFSQV